MVTSDFITLLKQTSDLCGLDQDNIQTDDFQILRGNISRRLGQIWDAENWPDIRNVEKRGYRADYSASETLTAATLTAVTERFFPQTGNCYQALRNMPLAVTSITRAGTTATVTTTSPHLLATGDQTTISGATEPPYNITATITVTGGSTFTYVMESDPGGSATGTPKVGVNPAQVDDDTIKNYWGLCEEDYGADEFDRSKSYAVGDQVYYPPTNRSYQCIATAAAGFLPTNTTYFIPLTDFNRYVAYEQTGKTKIGDVLGVYSKSPIIWYDAEPVNYYLSGLGVQVLDDWSTVFVEFKTKVPVLYGDTFSASATYTANVDQVYYRSSANPSLYPGNFYDCITTTSVGDSPESAAAKWQLVSIPRIFERYLVQGAYSDYLAADGMAEKRAIEDAKAEEILAQLRYRIGGVQNQTRRTVVLTR